MDENEGQESVTETSESTESQSEGAESSSESGSKDNSQLSSGTQIKPDETPFHEHPRFKELVEQKNAALQSQRNLELKLAQLEGRLSSQSTPAKQAERDELIEDLKKIDPRLASRLEAFGNSSKTIEQLQAKLEQFEKAQHQTSQQSQVKEAVARINGWHDANKAPNEIKAAVNAQLDVLYMQGKLTAQNLEAEYKKAYEPYKAFVENTKREALKGYVQDKKVDSKVPTSQPKGAPAKPGKPAELPKFRDREELRAAVAKEFVQNQTAKRQASSV